jgi:hypothetical protein
MKFYFTLLLILSFFVTSACTFEDNDNEGSYEVQGNLYHLDGKLTLSLNGNEEIIILNDPDNQRSQFSFRQKLYAGNDVKISILKQPESQFCQFYENQNLIGESISGVVEDQDFNNMYIDCLSYNRISNNPQSISTGYYHTCIIDNDGAKCMGQDSRYTQGVNITQLPTGLINPINITSSHSHGCVLDDTGIACWGAEENTRIPSNLINPRELQVGGGFSCALDDEGLKCWGWDFLSSIISMDINNASNLTVGRASACILDNGKPICRATSDSLIPSVPDILDHVTDISIHESTACAIQDNKLYCWGSWVNPQVYGVELGADLSWVKLGGDVSCLANEETVACTSHPIGSLMEAMVNIVPDAKSIGMGIYHVCAMNDEAVTCFGSASAYPDSILAEN